MIVPKRYSEYCIYCICGIMQAFHCVCWCEKGIYVLVRTAKSV